MDRRCVIRLTTPFFRGLLHDPSGLLVKPTENFLRNEAVLIHTVLLSATETSFFCSRLTLLFNLLLPAVENSLPRFSVALQADGPQVLMIRFLTGPSRTERDCSGCVSVSSSASEPRAEKQSLNECEQSCSFHCSSITESG